MDFERIANVFARIDRELWIVTAADPPAGQTEDRSVSGGGAARRSGLIATFVAQASIVPELPRVLVGLAKQHFTWELVEASGAFALHLIRPEQLDWVWRFGLQSGRDGDKFDGLNVRIGSTGSPLLTDAPAWLECRVEDCLDTGDRTVYLAEVVDGALVADGAVLTMQRLLEQAPPEKLKELKEQLVTDSRADFEAIRAWRTRRP